VPIAKKSDAWKAVVEWCKTHPPPEIWKTDKAQELAAPGSRWIEEVQKRKGMSENSAAYFHWQNGKAERSIRTSR